MTSSGIKLVVIWSCIFSVIFVIFGGFLEGYSLPSVIFLAFTGIIFGAIAAPLIEPKAFRYPTLWQITISTITCVFIAALLGAGIDGYLLAILTGVILGYFAQCWITYFTGP